MSYQMVDERDKGDKLWELLSKLHENPPKADHGKTVRTYLWHSMYHSNENEHIRGQQTLGYRTLNKVDDCMKRKC